MGKNKININQSKTSDDSKPIQVKEEPIGDLDFAEDLAALQNTANEETSNATNTLFVRGIPFTATNEEFEAFFEEVGPIKNSFLVGSSKEKDQDKPSLNKGYGFVHYALKEDATKAIEELSKQTFQDRLLKMEFAHKKPSTTPEESKAKKEQKKPVPKTFVNAKPKTNEVEEDRTVAISDIPVSMGKARLTQFLASHNVKPESTYFTTGFARAVYETVELAQMACSSIQNKLADNKPLHATILTNMLLKSKNSRLIVRNLPFKVTEVELKKLFEPYGPVIDVKIPRKPDSNLRLGFGFIQYPSFKSSDKAIEGLNNTKLKDRTIAVDFCTSKNKFKSDHPDEEKDDEEEEEVSVKDEELDQNEVEIKEEEDDDAMDQSGPLKNSMFEDEEPEDLLETSDEEGDEDDEEEPKEEDNDELSVKKDSNDKANSKDKKLNIAHECTLFCRNLLFETTDADLFEKFSEFGRLLYARVVFDKETGRSKGTGFICFANPKDATNCLELSKQLNWEEESVKNLKSKKSVLIREATSDIAEKFTVQGRLVLVAPAVTKETATDLARGDKFKDRIDKRNYYLLREGVIFPESDVGKKLRPAELEKRQASFTARKTQLKSNPSLFVSKTRLAVRNLPLEVDEKSLKSLVHSAVNKFKNQVREGLRLPLSTTEQSEGWDKVPAVTQSKIVRSKDRIDPKTNLPRSLGYGFVEFSHHSHALAALRYLNCNPNLFLGEAKKGPKNKGKDNFAASSNDARGGLLMVEFSIENRMILKQREERKDVLAKRKIKHDAFDKEKKRRIEEEDKKSAKPKQFLNKKHMKKKQGSRN